MSSTTRGRSAISSSGSGSPASKSIAPRGRSNRTAPYGAGTFVIPMTQVFARYAKDLLEQQTYPEVRRGPNEPAEPPYDVTAWSLGMLLGVDVDFGNAPLPSSLRLTPRARASPQVAGRVAGTGARFTFEYAGADTAIAINRLLKDGARVAFDRPSQRVGRPRIPRARWTAWRASSA